MTNIADFNTLTTIRRFVSKRSRGTISLRDFQLDVLSNEAFLCGFFAVRLQIETAGSFCSCGQRNVSVELVKFGSKARIPPYHYTLFGSYIHRRGLVSANGTEKCYVLNVN